jgi:hypothetical protein
LLRIWPVAIRYYVSRAAGREKGRAGPAGKRRMARLRACYVGTCWSTFAALRTKITAPTTAKTQMAISLARERGGGAGVSAAPQRIGIDVLNRTEEPGQRADVTVAWGA